MVTSLQCTSWARSTHPTLPEPVVRSFPPGIDHCIVFIEEAHPSTGRCCARRGHAPRLQATPDPHAGSLCLLHRQPSMGLIQVVAVGLLIMGHGAARTVSRLVSPAWTQRASRARHWCVGSIALLKNHCMSDVGGRGGVAC